MEKTTTAVGLCILAAVAVLLLPIQMGFAYPYSSTSNVTGNTVSSDYFSVGIFSYSLFDPDDIVEQTDYSDSFHVETTAFSDSIEVLYAQVDSDYVINSEYVLTYDNRYLGIVNSGDTAESYTLSFSDGIPAATKTAYGVSGLTVQYKLADQPYRDVLQTSVITSGQMYKLSIKIIVNYSDTEVPPNIEFDFTVSSTRTSSGTLNDSHTTNVGRVSTNSAIDEVMDANDMDTTSLSYGGNTYNLSDPDPDNTMYEGNDSVRITNSNNGDGGVATPGNGAVNLRMNLPSDSLFAIAISYTEPHNGKPQVLTVTITTQYDGIIMDDVDISLPGTGIMYIVKGGYDGATYQTSFPSDGQWLDYDGDIEIDLFAAQGSGHGNIQSDTTFDIIIKTTS